MAPFGEMEEWFDEMFRHPLSLFRMRMPRPRFPGWENGGASVDMYDDGENLVLKAELPGFTKDDVDVMLTEDAITISGEKKKEEKVEKRNYYRIEREAGSFARAFRLPVEVDATKVSAKFKNGILEVRLPKTEKATRKTRKVKVR